MQNNATSWIIGVVVLILAVLAIWWYAQSGALGTSGNATTTPQVATTTDAASEVGNAKAVTSTRSSGTVNQVIAGLTGVSTFQALYNSTGVAASVTGKGPYTIFVPTDGAFGRLPSGTLRSLTAAQEKRLIQNHIVVGKMLDLDAVSSGTHTSLSKDTLNFNVQPQTKIAYVGSGYAIKQYKASNGIVYVITAVLLPPQTPSSTTGATGTPHP